VSAMQIEPGMHRCQHPKHTPVPVDMLTVNTRWRCPECGQRWEGAVWAGGSETWTRRGPDSTRWRKRRRAELAKLAEGEQ